MVDRRKGLIKEYEVPVAPCEKFYSLRKSRCTLEVHFEPVSILQLYKFNNQKQNKVSDVCDGQISAANFVTFVLPK